MKVLAIFLLFVGCAAGTAYSTWVLTNQHHQKQGTLTVSSDELIISGEEVEELIKSRDRIGKPLDEKQKNELRKIAMDRHALAKIGNSWNEAMRKLNINNAADYEAYIKGNDSGKLDTAAKGSMQDVLVSYSQETIDTVHLVLMQRLMFIAMRRVTFAAPE